MKKFVYIEKIFRTKIKHNKKFHLIQLYYLKI